MKYCLILIISLFLSGCVTIGSHNNIGSVNYLSPNESVYYSKTEIIENIQRIDTAIHKEEAHIDSITSQIQVLQSYLSQSQAKINTIENKITRLNNEKNLAKNISQNLYSKKDSWSKLLNDRKKRGE